MKCLRGSSIIYAESINRLDENGQGLAEVAFDQDEPKLFKFLIDRRLALGSEEADVIDDTMARLVTKAVEKNKP